MYNVTSHSPLPSISEKWLNWKKGKRKKKRLGAIYIKENDNRWSIRLLDWFPNVNKYSRNRLDRRRRNKIEEFVVAIEWFGKGICTAADSQCLMMATYIHMYLIQGSYHHGMLWIFTTPLMSYDQTTRIRCDTGNLQLSWLLPVTGWGLPHFAHPQYHATYNRIINNHSCTIGICRFKGWDRFIRRNLFDDRPRSVGRPISYISGVVKPRIASHMRLFGL